MFIPIDKAIADVFSCASSIVYETTNFMAIFQTIIISRENEYEIEISPSKTYAFIIKAGVVAIILI